MIIWENDKMTSINLYNGCVTFNNTYSDEVRLMKKDTRICIYFDKVLICVLKCNGGTLFTSYAKVQCVVGNGAMFFNVIYNKDYVNQYMFNK